MNILIVVDMQNDFISGTLGTPEAQSIVENVVSKIKSFDGMVLATRDTHGGNYLETAEGKKLHLFQSFPRDIMKFTEMIKENFDASYAQSIRRRYGP